MASTYSTDLKIELMVTGENAGTWGDKTNTNLNLVQQAIAGFESISIAGGAQTTTLVMTDGALSNARNAVIKLTGAITGNQIVTIPTGIEKTYTVSNGTTGAFTVEFKQAGGTGVTFGTTDKSTKTLFADGTNIVDVGNVTETGVQTLTNKTLTSPKIGTSILDTNGNELTLLTATGSAVNEFTIANSATANAPELSTTGSDTNIDLKITPKGTGKIILDGIAFPNADGSANQALITNGSGVLSFAGVSASAGQVIQVLSTTKTDKFSISSTLTFTDITGLSVSITPASASNKILITGHISGGGNICRVAFRLMRDSTAISIGDSAGSRQESTVGATGAASNDHLNASFNFLDSPSSTSSITYKVQMICEDAATINSSHGDANTNAAPMTRSVSTITVMEVKG